MMPRHTPAGGWPTARPRLQLLQRGDVYEVTIEGIGTFPNPLLGEDD